MYESNMLTLLLALDIGDAQTLWASSDLCTFVVGIYSGTPLLFLFLLVEVAVQGGGGGEVCGCKMRKLVSIQDSAKS
jgi:hypothetical protein